MTVRLNFTDRAPTFKVLSVATCPSFPEVARAIELLGDAATDVILHRPGGGAKSDLAAWRAARWSG